MYTTFLFYSLYLRIGKNSSHFQATKNLFHQRTQQQSKIAQIALKLKNYGSPNNPQYFGFIYCKY